MRDFIQSQLDLMWSRLGSFEEELNRLLDGIPADVLASLADSDEFIHCLSITVERVVRTHRDSKIRVLARLLAQMATDEEFVPDTDQYEELLGVLDELSPREIHALVILRRHEETHRREWNSSPEQTINRINAYWADFLTDLYTEVGLEEGETDGFLLRLSRSGLFGLYSVGLGTGSILGPGMVAGVKGILTPQFTLLADVVGSDEEPAP